MKGSGNEALSKNGDLDTISPDGIKQVLDASYFAQPLPPTPLRSMLLFLTYIEQQYSLDAPPSKTHEDYLLLELLSQLIFDALALHREIFGLPSPNRKASLKTAIDEIRCDFRQNAIELEAWSFLYFRYVRVDLQLTRPQIEAVTLLDERTLRRRQQRGFLRLTHQIIQQDLAIRQDLEARWLYLAQWASR